MKFFHLNVMSVKKYKTKTLPTFQHASKSISYEQFLFCCARADTIFLIERNVGSLQIALTYFAKMLAVYA